MRKRAFDYSKFDDLLIACLLAEKFADFLPNHRQEEILKRSNVKLPRSTMKRLNTQAVGTAVTGFCWVEDRPQIILKAVDG